MTIYIETDLEGISGVDDISQIMDEKSEGHYMARKRLMADLNAAVRGFCDGGADKVLVEDGHGCRGNFIPELLDDRAEMCEMKSGFDFTGTDACATVGAHAMAGTSAAFLDHTQSSVCWHNYSINGIRCGEIVQTALYLGTFGAPCIMVSGDRAACLEAHRFFDNAGGCGYDIETACVKDARIRNHAILADSEEAERRIYEAAKRSVKLVGKVPPFTMELPLRVELEFNRADYCDSAFRPDKHVRTDARTLVKTVEKITSLWDLLF